MLDSEAIGGSQISDFAWKEPSRNSRVDEMSSTSIYGELRSQSYAMAVEDLRKQETR